MISIKNISMHYGSTRALADVSFDVEQGEILGLLGPNGAGKSTLMKILTTFIYPSNGTAMVEGFDILEQPLKVRELVGYLPENVPLYMDMRVDEYMAFVGGARGMKGAELEKRFKWLREACGIVPVWKHAINELSKGFRQRVGLAQALIHDPELLILDEPTAGLDPRQMFETRAFIAGLKGERSVLISTHMLGEVSELCDKVVIISNGRVVLESKLSDLAGAKTLGEIFMDSVTLPSEKAFNA